MEHAGSTCIMPHEVSGIMDAWASSRLAAMQIDTTLKPKSSKMSGSQRMHCEKNEDRCSCGSGYKPNGGCCDQCGKQKGTTAQGGHLASSPHDHKQEQFLSPEDETSKQPKCPEDEPSEIVYSSERILADGITTMMMCGIPCRRSVCQVVDVINEHGFEGTYDLVYLPEQKRFQSSRRKHSLGYAFVNFKLPEHAAAFCTAFQDYVFPTCTSDKVSYTKPARCQGYEANLQLHSQHRMAGCFLLF